MKRSNTQSKYTEIRTVRGDQAEKPQSSKARQLTDRMITVILVGVLAVGIGLLAYPSFSDYWNSFHQSRAVMSYAEQVADMNTEEYGKILDAAHAYNERLAENGINWVMSDEERQSYEEQLNVSGNGVMGYIKIQKIDVTLPIYHGTDESVLQSSIGHLEQSSLPVGGESTHCLLSGHRGLPSARLFTDLDKLKEGGDIFVWEGEAVSIPDQLKQSALRNGYIAVPFGVLKNDVVKDDQVVYRKGETYFVKPAEDNMIHSEGYINKFKPYIGFGYGGHLFKGSETMISFDAGVMFWGGSPKLVTHDGVDLVHDLPKIRGSVGRTVDFAKMFTVFPVINLRLTQRIF